MMEIYMVGAGDVLLRELESRKVTQASVALTYAFCIKNDHDKYEAVDWPKINNAIIERWSASGLRRVKEMAWKRIKAKA